MRWCELQLKRVAQLALTIVERHLQVLADHDYARLRTLTDADEDMLRDYLTRAAQINPEHPVLVDRFLDDAVEIDVDALFDGTDMYLGGVMEHIEEAGIHSGDSATYFSAVHQFQHRMFQVRRSGDSTTRDEE